MSDASKRDFLKKAALGAAVVATTGVLKACAGTPEESVAPAPEPEQWDYETDVVIAGGGNGGLSAACAAAENGKRGILVEASSIVGGGSAWSGGVIHAFGARNAEEYNTYTEGFHDPVLGKRYVETFRNDYLPWLEAIGAPLIPGDPSVGLGVGSEPRMGESGDIGHQGKRRFFKYLQDNFENNGGTVMLSTRARKLIMDETGAVTGLQIQKSDGTLESIKANAVILATGNFMGNKSLMQKYVAPHADMARNMGVPYNTGEGMLMAQAAGAMLSGAFESWSGMYCAITPAKCMVDDPVEYEKMIAEDPDTMPGSGAGRLSPPMWVGLLHPEDAKGILINLDGQRFKDESCPINSKYARLPMSILHQREGKVFMIADANIAEDTPGSQAMLDAIIAEGGQVVIADTLEELADGMYQQGVYKSQFVKMINEYNEAAASGTGEELNPPRMNGHYPVTTPPFYAVPTTSQVYCTYGGISINENTQVLDLQKLPIRGLYAVPPAAGGVFKSVYMGGIGVAGAFGYIAGKSV